MISCDTNILFAACDADSAHHARARAFLSDHAEDEGFCLCEQVLMELYCLLRNSVVIRKPLSPGEAVGLIHHFRSNPVWLIVDVVSGHGLMDGVWKKAGMDAFAYRRVFDIRLAMTLRHHGVTAFATRNTQDFREVGFAKVWDPTSG